ncbi:MAG: adenylate kinase [Candidatus Azotimanducaceae bacterium]|jgi:adenylate kinase
MAHETKYQSIILMGQAGTGKGTQAKLLSEALGYGVFSLGDISREYAAQDSPLGRHIAGIHLTSWIPEWLASYMMTKAILEDFAETGVVFESVARKPEEARKFHEIHEAIDRSYIVIHLVAPKEVVVERMLSRQREGYDTQENIDKRLKAFEEETVVSINFFNEQNALKEVDAHQLPEKVFEDIITLIT